VANTSSITGVRAGYQYEASRLMAIAGGGISVNLHAKSRPNWWNTSYPKPVFCRFTSFCNTRQRDCWMRSQDHTRRRFILSSRRKCASSAASVFPCQTASVSFTRLPQFHHPQLQIADRPAHFQNVTDFYCCKGIASVAYHHPTRMSGQFSSP
jgi:hypothetical protein